MTAGALRPELAAIAVPVTADGRNMTGADLALTAGWGHNGTGGAVMPGHGRVTERPHRRRTRRPQRRLPHPWRDDVSTST